MLIVYVSAFQNINEFTYMPAHFFWLYNFGNITVLYRPKNDGAFVYLYGCDRFAVMGGYFRVVAEPFI